MTLPSNYQLRIIGDDGYAAIGIFEPGRFSCQIFKPLISNGVFINFICEEVKFFKFKQSAERFALRELN